MQNKNFLMPDERARLNRRSKELIAAISTMNSYDDLLRVKYYPVMLHSISLLMQYTLILQEE